MNSSQEKKIVILISLVLFVLAFVPKFLYIGTRDICLDEPFTIFHAQKDFIDLLKSPTLNGPNPPLFMFLLHFWIKLFGISPYAVRILPLIFNALTVVFIFLSGKKVFNTWAGLLGSLLFLLSTYHFYFGLETRAYSMLSCAAIASYYYFNQIVTYPEKRIYVAYLFVSNVVLVYSHYFGWFVVFVQFAGSLFYFKNKKALVNLGITFGLTAISFIPLAILFVKQFLKSSEGTWVTPPSKSEYVNQLYWFLNAKEVFGLIVGLLAMGIVLFYFQKNDWKRLIKKELIILFLWWFIPYTIMFLVSQKIPMFLNRYILFNTVAFYLFIASLLIVLYKGNLQKFIFPAIITVVAVFMFMKLQVNSKEFYYREVQNTVTHVKNHTDDNSIIIIHPHWAHLGFTYYYKPEIFSNPKQYDSLLLADNIFPVWDVNMTKNYLKEFPDRKVVYYQDGSLFTDENNTIFKHLNSQYQRVDSVFYPECFYVSVYTPIKVDTTQITN